MTELDVRTAPPAEELDESRESLKEGDRWNKLLDRLNDLSVTKHFDAYADMRVGRPGVRARPDRPAAGSSTRRRTRSARREWYRRCRRPTARRLGCELVASKMKIGLVFENILKRGLLEFAMTLPNGSPEFRYAYHEVIEEAQHSLMFQEFVNRSGYDAPGLAQVASSCRRGCIVALGRQFPAAVLPLRARRRGPDRLRAAARAAQRPGDASAARAHHAHPRHRGGAAPVVRAALPQAHRAVAEPRIAAPGSRSAHR